MAQKIRKPRKKQATTIASTQNTKHITTHSSAVLSKPLLYSEQEQRMAKEFNFKVYDDLLELL